MLVRSKNLGAVEKKRENISWELNANLRPENVEPKPWGQLGESEVFLNPPHSKHYREANGRRMVDGGPQTP